MPKLKTHKSTYKRIKITKSGKLKRRRAFRSHLKEKKSQKRNRLYRASLDVSKANEKNIKLLLPYGKGF